MENYTNKWFPISYIIHEMPGLQIPTYISNVAMQYICTHVLYHFNLIEKKMISELILLIWTSHILESEKKIQFLKKYKF